MKYVNWAAGAAAILTASFALFGCATASAPTKTATPTGVVLWNNTNVLDKVDVIPIARSFPDAPYPPEMLQAGISGSATIAFAVDVDGRCVDIAVKSATRSEFAAVGLAVVTQAKFHPATVGGQPRKCRLEWPFIFEIQ